MTEHMKTQPEALYNICFLLSFLFSPNCHVSYAPNVTGCPWFESWNLTCDTNMSLTLSFSIVWRHAGCWPPSVCVWFCHRRSRLERVNLPIRELKIDSKESRVINRYKAIFQVLQVVIAKRLNCSWPLFETHQTTRAGSDVSVNRKLKSWYLNC